MKKIISWPIQATLILILLISVTVRANPLVDVGRKAISDGEYERAFEILTPIANDGNSIAQNALGVLYLNGWGISQNFSLAKSWFLKSAKQNDPKAQFNMGKFYDTGQDGTKDLKKAYTWYKMSAEKGYAPAQVMLGSMYAIGDAINRDYKKAMTWYKKAAEQHDPEAQRRIAHMYLNGEGVSTNYKMAKKWYEKSARQGYPAGIYWLGRIYEDGLGVSKNPTMAVQYYAGAARALMLDAQLRLGKICIEGKSKQCNRENGLSWLRLAADLGNKDALDILRNYYKKGHVNGKNHRVISKSINDELLDAAYLGRTEDILFFLKKGANPNTKWHDQSTKSFVGMTPLHFAAQKGNVVSAKELLALGANPSDGKSGDNILISAIPRSDQSIWDEEGRAVKIIEILIKHRTSVNVPNSMNYYPLGVAASRNKARILKLLINNGAKLDTMNNMGTALIMAARSGSTDCVRLLLENGASVNIKTQGGHTALSIAKSNGHEYIAWLLKKYGAKED